MSTLYTKLSTANKRPLRKVLTGLQQAPGQPVVPPSVFNRGVRVSKATKRKIGVSAGFPTLLKS